MGRTTTPKYRLEIDDGTNSTSLAWEGKPTANRLEAYILSYAKSLELGGTNQHIAKAIGFVPYPNKARIVRQEDCKVMATWKAAMFQVW